MNEKRPPYKNYKPKDWPDPEEFDTVELKLDGWLFYLVLEDTEWELYSRSHRLLESGELTQPIKKSMIVGEYCFGTQWAKSQPDLYKKLIAFDAIWAFGHDVSALPTSARRAQLELVVGKLNEEKIVEGLLVTEQFPIEVVEDLWQDFVIENDWEGLVFKNSRAEWTDGMGRMKKDATMDYVIIGFLESDSDTYAGSGVASIIGGLYVDGELVQKCKVCGLTTELREEFYNNPDKYIGKVFEAEGKKISKKGALRHPNFLRFREDKLPEECTWEF